MQVANDQIMLIYTLASFWDLYYELPLFFFLNLGSDV